MIHLRGLGTDSKSETSCGQTCVHLRPSKKSHSDVTEYHLVPLTDKSRDLTS